MSDNLDEEAVVTFIEKPSEDPGNTRWARFSDETESKRDSTLKARTMDGLVTLSEAQESEEDMRAELTYLPDLVELHSLLERESQAIQYLVASHLGISPAKVRVPPHIGPDGKRIWWHGVINLYIPIDINAPGSSLPTKVMFRLPMLHKIGEKWFPGNAEEKIRTEAATHIWTEKNCPDVPIPKLRGFGVTSGLSFFEPRVIGWWTKAKFYIWRFFCRVYSGSEFSDYIPQQRPTFRFGYIIFDWIENDEIRMLSETIGSPNTALQTKTLYRDLSRIMISLANISQPRIGSWTIDDYGSISLSNRPLFYHFYQLENWRVSAIRRGATYTDSWSFFLGMIEAYDNRLRDHPNAASSDDDARDQAGDLVLLKAVLPQYLARDYRTGPFVMQFTDLQTSNIFVDKDWNVKYVIDLEWVSSLPLECLLAPYWLTQEYVDTLVGKKYDRYKVAHDKFVSIFAQEEKSKPLYFDGSICRRAPLLWDSLSSGRFWYLAAFTSPTHLHDTVMRRIEPQFGSRLSSYWLKDMTSFLNNKRAAYYNYAQQVSQAFDHNISFFSHLDNK
ncbi:hypothetical protein FQN57_000232 [Myotisia sp. PD_48]|nr:hypothetical protein FQN57_000232 [Myotisia sp. PD_48]